MVKATNLIIDKLKGRGITIKISSCVFLASDDAQEISKLIAKYNFLLYCDDVYNILYFGEEPPQRLFPVGQSNQIISAGTFSKLLGPGLRVR